MSDPDDELLGLAVRGNQDALGTLLQRHGPQVRRRLAGRIAAPWRSVLEEDDVMQVTYLEAFLRIGQFTPAGPGAFIAWLTRIAENNLRDAVKELGRAKRPQPRKRVAQPTSEESLATLIEVVGVTTTTPSRQAARGEAAGILNSVLGSLPEDYEKVVRLYDLEGRPASEAAAQLGRSEGALYMLRARAHDRLRELLGPGSKFFSR